METDPQMISAYLIYLSQHAPVEEQASHNDLALVKMENDIIKIVIIVCFFFFSVSVFLGKMVHSLSPSAGRRQADRGALHHHEQPIRQTLLQARV